jgi:hypothetical protein
MQPTRHLMQDDLTVSLLCQFPWLMASNSGSAINSHKQQATRQKQQTDAGF